MALSDPISDGLTKIRNAARARHPAVDIRPTRLLGELLEILKREGFIRTYKVVGERPATRTMRVYLKYIQRRPAITQLVRVSKPGVRMYRPAKRLPRILGGMGVAVISTSRGVMTDRDAYQQRVGGEVICYVW